MLASGRDFDLAHAYLALFLKVSQSEHTRQLCHLLLWKSLHDFLLTFFVLFFFSSIFALYHRTPPPWKLWTTSCPGWRKVGRSYKHHLTNRYVCFHTQRAPCCDTHTYTFCILINLFWILLLCFYFNHSMNLLNERFQCWYAFLHHFPNAWSQWQHLNLKENKWEVWCLNYTVDVCLIKTTISRNWTTKCIPYFTQMFLLRCLSSFYKRDIQSSVVGSSAFQEIKNTINEHLCDLSLSHEHFCGLWDGIISYCK